MRVLVAVQVSMLRGRWVFRQMRCDRIGHCVTLLVQSSKTGVDDGEMSSAFERVNADGSFLLGHK